MDLEDSIFPNFPAIEKQTQDFALQQGLKEECVRLMYVAMTRPKDNLTMFWNEYNPSVFDRIINSDAKISTIPKQTAIRTGSNNNLVKSVKELHEKISKEHSYADYIAGHEEENFNWEELHDENPLLAKKEEEEELDLGELDLGELDLGEELPWEEDEVEVSPPEDKSAKLKATLNRLRVKDRG